LADRIRVFGSNILPARPSKSLWRLMWIAFTEKILILLSIAAAVSLALGLFQDFGPTRDPDQPPVEWIEGVAIIIAVIVVVLVGSLTDWQKERQFRTLNAKKDERTLKVVRDGAERQIDVRDVVVGDVALLEPGEIIPCDGVFLSGHNVRCDESAVNGESDVIKKVSYEECIQLRDEKAFESKEELLGLAHTDCFLVSGSRILEGVGLYVVVAVGQRSFNGRILAALQEETEDTTLQRKLDSLANKISMAGAVGGVVLFIGLMIRFFVKLGTGVPPMNSAQKGIAFVDILILSFTLVVASVPEGLPLAIALALAFATKRMTRENLLVRVLSSCETMANASVICTDKTGTLTQNEMTVVAGTLGVHLDFIRGPAQRPGCIDGPDYEELAGSSRHQRRTVELADLARAIPATLQKLVNDSIAINSTAFEGLDSSTGGKVFIGDKTETALLTMARDLGWFNYKATREMADVLQLIPFSSKRKSMAVVIGLPHGRARLYVKGASEVLVERSTRHVLCLSSEGVDDDVGVDAFDNNDRLSTLQAMEFHASQTLRTIAVCYRDFESWPPNGISHADNEELRYAELLQDLTFIGLFSIEDPLRPGVREAVTDCGRAGVQVKMCTGDSALTALSIAKQCGILTDDGTVMEGPQFRALSDYARLQTVPRLQVLARSSPEDKRILVNALKTLGEIVAVTGDGTNDGPALKAAHVGFSMGISGTEVAKEASDIVLMDDNFTSIVRAIMWGRTVNDAVRKFLQFQVTPTFTAFLITLVSALASSNSEDSVLSAVQLLWVAIIIDTFAAMALATDPTSSKVLSRKPERKESPLFTVNMIKQIIGQGLYQITVILVFHFLGDEILGFPSHDGRTATLVFNAFVFTQIFNSFNCRRLDRGLNVLEGVVGNPYFIGIIAIEVGVQVLIMFVGGVVFAVVRIGGREWGISLALAAASIPLGAIIRLIPNEPCQRIFVKLCLYREPALLPSSQAQPGLELAHTMLQEYADASRRLRGGRLRMRMRPKANEEAMTLTESRSSPSMFTMIPSLVGTYIVGSNWASQLDHTGLQATAGEPSTSVAHG
ncbi:hypothetical protein K488DRAFT_61078, partial [Vararia minispora EC-137]